MIEAAYSNENGPRRFERRMVTFVSNQNFFSKRQRRFNSLSKYNIYEYCRSIKLKKWHDILFLVERSAQIKTTVMEIEQEHLCAIPNVYNSRKIYHNKFGRHFSQWKPRSFIVDKERGILVVHAIAQETSALTTTIRPALSYRAENSDDLELPLFSLNISHHSYYNHGDTIATSHGSTSHSPAPTVMSSAAAPRPESGALTECLSIRCSASMTSNDDDELELLLLFENATIMAEWRRQMEDERNMCPKVNAALAEAPLGRLYEMAIGRIAVHYAALNSKLWHQDQCPSWRSDRRSEHVGECNKWNSGASAAIPHMRILIMAVGTRGDLDPFLQIAAILRQDGHRVRVATHSVYRELVVNEHNLEFFPLAGDPHQLSSFMVKCSGNLVTPTGPLLANLPKYLGTMNDIINSCWDACVLSDPLQAGQDCDFIPDAIISNPVTYAHIHCAEALGVPLHLMFPQPWVPTKAFPHPLSCLPYRDRWTSENFLSYQLVDRLSWIGLESTINEFRTKKLGLPALGVGEGAWDLLNSRKIPFCKLWSPLLVPKPKDWGEHVDIVGTFKSQRVSIPHTTDENPPTPAAQSVLSDAHSSPAASSALPRTALSHSDYPNDPGLIDFLNNGEPPVFIGFGSMVIGGAEAESFLKIFLEGAAVTGTRVLVQRGWSPLTEEVFRKLAIAAQRTAQGIFEADCSPRGGPCGTFSANDRSVGATCVPTCSAYATLSCVSSDFEPEQHDHPCLLADAIEASRKWNADSDAYMIGSVPHVWLFDHVAAVVHHGGAGTTAAGLQAAKPTFVIPHFGDQHFWGSVCHKHHLGPPPCPASQLSLPRVVEGLQALKNPQTAQNALVMSKKLSAEDGAKSAVAAFYKHLPINVQLCQVSVFMGENQLAQVYCVDCCLRMTVHVSNILHVGELSAHQLMPCSHVHWPIGPASAADGFYQGIGGFVREVAGGVADCIYQPCRGGYHSGIQGSARGVITGLRSLVCGPITGSALLAHKVRAGVEMSLTSTREKLHAQSPEHLQFSGKRNAVGLKKRLEEAVKGGRPHFSSAPTYPRDQPESIDGEGDDDWQHVTTCKEPPSPALSNLPDIAAITLSTNAILAAETQNTFRLTQLAYASALATRDLMTDLIRADEFNPRASRLSFDALARVLAFPESGREGAAAHTVASPTLHFVQTSQSLSQALARGKPFIDLIDIARFLHEKGLEGMGNR